MKQCHFWSAMRLSISPTWVIIGQILQRAHIPESSKTPLTERRFRSQFVQMRAESNRSPGFFQQLCLLFLSGLTWRLYSLKSRIEAVKREVEVCRTTLLTNFQIDYGFPSWRWMNDGLLFLLTRKAPLSLHLLPLHPVNMTYREFKTLLVTGIPSDTVPL